MQKKMEISGKFLLMGEETIAELMHWNMQNISPRDPVLLALCKQSELTEAIAVAKKKAMKNK